MAKPSEIRRPTERSAKDRPPIPLNRLIPLLAFAVRNNDRYGACVFYHQIDRAMGGVR
jgi:hypothetical protein